MAKLMAFLSVFSSYLLVFAVAVVLVIVAVFLGIHLRKRKNATTDK